MIFVEKKMCVEKYILTKQKESNHGKNLKLIKKKNTQHLKICENIMENSGKVFCKT